MSIYNTYAQRLNSIARESFEQYRKAEAAYKAAGERAKEYPQRMGAVDAQYAARAARAQADLVDATAALKAAKVAMENRTSEINAIRTEFAAAVEAAHTADPAQLDNATLTLLESGILTAKEYAYLLEKAQAARNSTMVRLIGKYAGDAAQAEAEKFGTSDAKATALRHVAAKSRTYTGAELLEAFDGMVAIYGRCAANPLMIDHWERFTAETVANL